MAFFLRHFIINPLQSIHAKSTLIRKVKTDATDAWLLVDMYYRGDVKPHRTWDEPYTELQHVTRQHEFVTSMYIQAKLNTRALLDQVLPAYKKVFYDVFSITSLRILQLCLKDETEEIGKVIQESTGKSHSLVWIKEKEERLRQVLVQWSNERKSSSQTSTLLGMTSLLIEFQRQLRQLEEIMCEIAEALPEVELLKSIPGIGEKIAATITAEIGNVSQFGGAKQIEFRLGWSASGGRSDSYLSVAERSGAF